LRPLLRPSSFLAAACLLAASYASHALSPLPPNVPDRRMAVQETSLAQLKVVDRQSGQALPLIWHQGRAYVAGQPGRRYALALRNMTADERLLAVMSVDGVNIVTGDTAFDSQSGYVFGAGERYEINGWRKSQSQIAAFEFTALENSYAARTGRPSKVGEIRVALFREDVPVRLPAYEPPISRSSPARASENKATAKPDASRSGLFGAGSASQDAAATAATPAPAAPAAPRAESRAEASDSAREREASPGSASLAKRQADKSAEKSAEKLGTGHGRREQSYTEHTSFQRAQAQPNEVLVIYYDSRENLIAQGVLPRPSVAMVDRCSKRADNGYVPDPC
jgi:hypothetical protein